MCGKAAHPDPPPPTAHQAVGYFAEDELEVVPSGHASRASTPTMAADTAPSSEPSPLIQARLEVPPDASADEWSDLLFSYGAMYVSLADGNAGTPDETPVYVAHPPDSAQRGGQLETWEVLTEARHLWCAPAMPCIHRACVESSPASHRHHATHRSNCTLEVGFRAATDVEAIMLRLAVATGLDGPPRYTVDDVLERDWVAEVQSTWDPVLIGDMVRIAFPWHEPEMDGVPTIVLEPGMAFGTGAP